MSRPIDRARLTARCDRLCDFLAQELVATPAHIARLFDLKSVTQIYPILRAITATGLIRTHTVSGFFSEKISLISLTEAGLHHHTAVPHNPILYRASHTGRTTYHHRLLLQMLRLSRPDHRTDWRREPVLGGEGVPRPDALYRGSAIELELSAKNNARYQKIILAHDASIANGLYENVLYLFESPTLRAFIATQIRRWSADPGKYLLAVVDGPDWPSAWQSAQLAPLAPPPPSKASVPAPAPVARSEPPAAVTAAPAPFVIPERNIADDAPFTLVLANGIRLEGSTAEGDHPPRSRLIIRRMYESLYGFTEIDIPPEFVAYPNGTISVEYIGEYLVPVSVIRHWIAAHGGEARERTEYQHTLHQAVHAPVVGLVGHQLAPPRA